MRSICFFFYAVSGLRSSLGFGFKGLPVGVDCDDELMIEVVMVCAVFVLEGGKDAIFFWCQCPCFVINVHIWTSNVHFFTMNVHIEQTTMSVLKNK